MVNEPSRNPLFFLRYSPPERSRVSHTAHSHSMILNHGNALISRCNFFLMTVETRPSSRQNFSLLISKAKSHDSGFARLRRLSITIGQFFASSIAEPIRRQGKKRPSTPIARSANALHWLFLNTIWTERKRDRLFHQTVARLQTVPRSLAPTGELRALPNAPLPRRGRSTDVASVPPELRL